MGRRAISDSASETCSEPEVWFSLSSSGEEVLASDAQLVAERIRCRYRCRRLLLWRCTGSPLRSDLGLLKRGHGAAGELNNPARCLGFQRRAQARLARGCRSVGQGLKIRRKEAGFLLINVHWLAHHPGPAARR